MPETYIPLSRAGLDDVIMGRSPIRRGVGEECIKYACWLFGIVPVDPHVCGNARRFARKDGKPFACGSHYMVLIRKNDKEWAHDDGILDFIDRLRDDWLNSGYVPAEVRDAIDIR